MFLLLLALQMTQLCSNHSESNDDYDVPVHMPERPDTTVHNNTTTYVDAIVIICNCDNMI